MSHREVSQMGRLVHSQENCSSSHFPHLVTTMFSPDGQDTRRPNHLRHSFPDPFRIQRVSKSCQSHFYFLTPSPRHHASLSASAPTGLPDTSRDPLHSPCHQRTFLTPEKHESDDAIIFLMPFTALAPATLLLHGSR